MKYYMAIKKKETLPFVTTWIVLEIIMLNEISPWEKMNNNKKGNFTFCHSMDRPGGYYTKWNKPGRERHAQNKLVNKIETEAWIHGAGCQRGEGRRGLDERRWRDWPKNISARSMDMDNGVVWGMGGRVRVEMGKEGSRGTSRIVSTIKIK